MSELLSESWLLGAGFKWHQPDQLHPENKNYLLWLGDCLGGGWTSFEDLGVEVCAYRAGSSPEIIDWFCWIRADTSHRYHRFIHIRHIKTVAELTALIEGLTGQAFDKANNLYGSMRTPEQAKRLREENDRLDLRLHRQQHPWYEAEKDGDRIQVRGDEE